eukprot:TRINITY_DN8875_c0_g1_i1.p1 TRINITY_DN8875_c0_g1~~TRINITY_DN8875_c0_g1_i1.p1  ORF type:complete len:357 (-),score=43.27 TRINITY_DN8875_c0_g1_i1:71-1141(-)
MFMIGLGTIRGGIIRTIRRAYSAHQTQLNYRDNHDPSLPFYKHSEPIALSAPHINIVPPLDILPTTQTSQHISQLKTFINTKENLIVITGAGMSTESGIPDYRSPNGSYSRGHRPIRFQEFANSHKNRQRYWARNLIGFSSFSQAKPHAGHKALVELEKRGHVHHLITQNVDDLHKMAGQQQVTQLHGSNNVVTCLTCSHKYPRDYHQMRLLWMNPQLLPQLQEFLTSVNTNESGTSAKVRSDGDAEIGSKVDYDDVDVPDCEKCGGILKPDVVFFGENIPAARKSLVQDLIRTKADGLLMIGSSLQVHSAFSLVGIAVERGLPLAIVNVGPTRADSLVGLKVHGHASTVLSAVLA